MDTELCRADKPSHHNHPLSVWVRASRAHFLVAAHMGLALCDEYAKRFSTPKKPNKVHACNEHLLWLLQNIPSAKAFPSSRPTPPPLCVDARIREMVQGLGEDQRTASSWGHVERAYRLCYTRDKTKIAKWRHGVEAPEFMKHALATIHEECRTPPSDDVAQRTIKRRKLAV